MRHIEHGGTQILLDSPQFKSQVISELGIERRQRFVHQINSWIAHQCAPNGDSLHLTARQLGCSILQFVFHAQHTGNLMHLGFDVRFTGFAQFGAQGKGQVVIDTQMRVE